MYFNSLSEFLHMAGHGKYVWSCVILTTLLIVSLFIISHRKFKKQHNLNSQLNSLPK